MAGVIKVGLELNDGIMVRIIKIEKMVKVLVACLK